MAEQGHNWDPDSSYASEESAHSLPVATPDQTHFLQFLQIAQRERRALTATLFHPLIGITNISRDVAPRRINERSLSGNLGAKA